jgi:hypothetical protein
VPDPGTDLFLGVHLIDQVLLEIDCAHRHEELGGIALREFDDRVDPGLLEQVGILPANALDAIEVRPVDPFKNRPRLEASILGDLPPRLGSGARFQEPCHGPDPCHFQFPCKGRANPFDIDQFHDVLLLGQTDGNRGDGRSAV